MKKFIKDNKWLILLVVIFILSLVPLLIISKYNHPSVDDYNYSIGTHNILVNGGNVFDLFKGAIDNVINFRKSWHGAYGAVFIMSFQPGIFGEQYYFFSFIFLISIFIFSTFYFTKTLMIDLLKQNKSIWIAISIILLILQIQFLPSAVQGFFWWNGAINYTFFYSLSLILFGMIIKYINNKNNKLHIILLLLLSFLIGGGNYSTSLVTIIVVTLISLYILLKYKGKNKKWIIILSSAILIGIGLLISVNCPGTLIRQQKENSTGLGVVSSIITSLILMKDYLILWTKPFMIIIFIFIACLLYPVVKKVNLKVKYPLLFTILTFGITAAHFTAPLYALGYTGDGRLVNLPYFYYCICIILNIFYYMCYIKNILIYECENKKIKYEKFISIFESIFNKYKYYFIVILILVFVISIKSNIYLSTSYNATISLKNGEAKQYDKELNNRINLYLDDNLKNVEVSELTVKPKVLFFSDIEKDKNYWANQSLKKYYNKNYIIIKK